MSNYTFDLKQYDRSDERKKQKAAQEFQSAYNLYQKAIKNFDTNNAESLRKAQSTSDNLVRISNKYGSVLNDVVPNYKSIAKNIDDNSNVISSTIDIVKKAQSVESEFLKDFDFSNYAQDKGKAGYEKYLQDTVENNPKKVYMAYKPNNDWSEERKYQFGYLYAEDKNKANEFAKKINESVDYNKTQEQTKRFDEKYKNLKDYESTKAYLEGDIYKKAEEYGAISQEERAYLRNKKLSYSTSKELQAELDELVKEYNDLDTIAWENTDKSVEEVNAAREKQKVLTEEAKSVKYLLDKKKAEEEFNKKYGNIEIPEDFKPTIEKKDGSERNNIIYNEINGFPARDDMVSLAIVSRNGTLAKTLDYVAHMKDDEKKLYNWIEKNKGIKLANEYFDDLIDYALDKRLNQDITEKFAEFSSQNAVIGSLVRTPLSLASGFEYAGNLVTGNVDKRGVITSAAQGLSEGVKSTWEYSKGKDTWDFLYDTGASAIDSLAALGLNFATGGTLGTLALSGSAASSTANDLIDRGANNTQIVLGSLAAGVTEYVFEKLSLEQLEAFKGKNIGKIFAELGAKGVAVQFLNSGITNLSEELNTELANIIVDDIIMGNLSNYKTNVFNYYQEGMTLEDAKKKASQDLGKQVALAAGSGFLMGLAFGGVGSTVGMIKAKYNAKTVGNNITQYKNGVTDLQILADSVPNLSKTIIKKINALDSKSNAVEVGLLANAVNVQVAENAQAQLTSALEKTNLPKREIATTVNQMIGVAVEYAATGTTEGKLSNRIALLSNNKNTETVFKDFFNNGMYGGNAIKTLAKLSYKQATGKNHINYQPQQENANLGENKDGAISQGTSAFESDNNGTINPEADKGFTVFKASQALKSKLEKVASKFGLTIEYFNGNPKKIGNGSYTKGTKVIRLNEQSEKPTAIVFSHELVHYLVQDKLYPRLQNILFSKDSKGNYKVKSAALKNWLKTNSQWKQGYADLNFAINVYAETYKTDYAKEDANGNYKYDAEGMAKVEEELICDFLADALFGQNVIVEGNDITELFATEVFKKDKKLGQIIIDAINHFISLFKDVDDVQQDLKRIAKKLQKMQENLSKKEASTEKGESEDTRYSKDVDKTDDNDYNKDRGEQDGKYGKNRSDEVPRRSGRNDKVEGLNQMGERKIGTREVSVDGRNVTVINSSAENAEQKRIREQNKAEIGFKTYYTVDGTNEVFGDTILVPNSYFEEESYTYNNGMASFTPERLEKLIDDYSVKVGGQLNNDYAKAYVAYISPTEFLSLTTNDDAALTQDAISKYKKLDTDVLKNMQDEPYLMVNFETGEVLEHDGRHRMALLREQGINKVAIIIKDIDSEKNKYTTKKITEFTLNGQELRNGKTPGIVTLREIIPLSPNSRNEVKQKFVENDADIRYSLSIDLTTLPDSELSDAVENETITKAQAEQELMRRYGKIPNSFKPKQNIVLTTEEIQKENFATSEFIDNVLRNGKFDAGMTDEQKAEIIKAITEHKQHKVITDENTIKKVQTLVENDYQKAVWEWLNYTNQKNVPLGKEELALGQQLLQHAAENGNAADTVKYLAELTEAATRAGQAVQSFSLLKKMGGIGRLYYVNRTLAAINRDIKKRFGDSKKAKLVELDSDYALILANAKTQAEIDAVLPDIFQNIAEQIPKTIPDIWNTWRYLSMLGNPRTHARNFLGNALFTGVRFLKDFVAATIQSPMKTENKTRVFITDAKYRKFASEYFEKHKNDILQHGRRDDLAYYLQNSRKPFGNRGIAKPFNAVTNINFDLLEWEDNLFKRINFVHSMAQYLQAKKIDLDNISEEQLNEVQKRATKEALEATFQDDNIAATLLTKLSRGTKYGQPLIEGVFPFKRTPTNIIKQGVYYSPLGFVRAIKQSFFDLRQGKITADELIDSYASALTGTGLFVLGVLLAGSGVAVGSLDPDDEEDKKDKMNGIQEYSIKIGDYTYTVDWLAPASIPFFMGVELQKAFSPEEEQGFFETIANITTKSLDPLVNLSMLSGFNNLLDAIKWNDGSNILGLGLESVASFVLQGAPTLFGQIARTFDDTRRITYVDKNKLTPDFVQEFVQKIQGKIPGWENEKTPYINAWGETESTGSNVASRAAQNFISPGYVSKYYDDPVTKELIEIYLETDKDAEVLPKSAAKYFSVNGQNKYLTADEYVTFAKEAGQAKRKYLEETFSNSAFDGLSAEQKATVVKNLYSYAEANAKTSISDYELSNTMQKVKNLETIGVSPVTFYIASALTSIENADANNSGSVTKKEKNTALKNSGIDNSTANKILNYNKKDFE